MFEAKSKVLQQIMDLADEAIMKHAKGRKKPSMVAMTVEAEEPEKPESKEDAKEPEVSSEDLRMLLSQLEGKDSEC